MTKKAKCWVSLFVFVLLMAAPALSHADVVVSPIEEASGNLLFIIVLVLAVIAISLVAAVLLRKAGRKAKAVAMEEDKGKEKE